MNYGREFLTIVLAHGLAVASPGPDFAMVIKQSITHGRRAALWTSVGVGCGLSLHVTYCLFGLGLLVKESALALTILKFGGAAYLAYLGVQALRAKARVDDVNPANREPAPTDRAAWTTGFLVNVLNPKVALFLISLFSLATSVGTPKIIQAGYGLWITLATIAWFNFVSVVFTRENVRRKFLRSSHWIDRALGIVFLGFAVSLVLVTLK